MSEPPISLRDVKEGGAAWITEAQLSALVEAVEAAHEVTWKVGYDDNAGHAALQALIDKLARFSFDTEAGT